MYRNGKIRGRPWVGGPSVGAYGTVRFRTRGCEIDYLWMYLTVAFAESEVTMIR